MSKNFIQGGGVDKAALAIPRKAVAAFFPLNSALASFSTLLTSGIAPATRIKQDALHNGK